MTKNDCLVGYETIEKRYNNRKYSDLGFMGKTHALSAVAVFLLILAFVPDFSISVLQTSNIWVIVFAGILTIGASLIPDLDNSSSTARNSLGLIGSALSVVLRWLSIFVQTTIRRKKDNKDPDPHRGFAHTIPFAALLGVGIYYLTQIKTHISLENIGIKTIGDLSAVIISTILLYLAMIALVKPMVKTLRNGSDIIILIISLAATIGVFSQIGESHSYWWIGIAVALGCVIHDFGDCFTTAGCPILFPLPIKGRLWWQIRFTKIKAGGDEENKIIIPILIILIIIAIGVMVAKHFNYL